ncbi:MAG: hypothetical protein ACLR1R_10750 [Ruminococcus callidus]
MDRTGSSGTGGLHCLSGDEFTGFSMQVEKIAGYAPEIHEKMRQLAVQCGIAIGYGCTSQEQHGKGENHYTLLDKNGGVLSDYVKIHPFSYGGEDRFYHSGEKLTSAVLERVLRGNADLL